MLLATILCLKSLAWGKACEPKIERALEQAAKKYELELSLLEAIAWTESTCKPGAINRKTQDYGLMQINVRTAKAYGYSVQEIMHVNANIDVAARVLVSMRKRFKRQQNWECGYNLGTAKNVPNWSNCMVYIAKLRQHGYVTDYELVAQD